MLPALPELHSIVVYTASCWDCDDCYIGKTKRLSNRRGWVGRGWVVVGRGSQIPPSIHVMYAYFYAVSNALSQHFVRDLFLACTQSDSPQGIVPKMLRVTWFTYYYSFYFFISDWKFQKQTRTYKDKDILADKDILPLTDKDQLLLYKCQLQDPLHPLPPYYRKPGHLIRMEFVSGVVSKNVRFARRWNSITN